MPTCSICKINKEWEEFYPNPTSITGLRSSCKSCDKAKRDVRFQDSGYRSRRNKNAADRRYKLRVEVLTHYSGGWPTCSCCGEQHLEFLAIDHINEDGNAHRKYYNLKSSTSMLNWLKKNNYPDGFRILCHNCNMAKAFYGQCPHQKAR